MSSGNDYLRLYFMRNLLFVCLIGLAPVLLLGQTVQFSGRLVNPASTTLNIQGAHLLLINNDIQYNAISDTLGKFTFINVEQGEYKLIVSHLNYNRIEQNISLFTDIYQDILLVPIANELDEFEIVALEKNSQVNDMSLVSTNTFSIKMAEKFPAVLEDPGRIATLYAGVSGGTNDEENEVTVRGNNPRGNLWRVEELDLISPNHFTEEGKTGGSVSIISGNIIDKSDILIAAFQQNMEMLWGSVRYTITNWFL